MKKRLFSILLTLCMVICLMPMSVLADDTALRSITVQNIGPTEAAVENDLYEKMSLQVSVITLINDIELSGCLSIDYEVTIDLNGHVLKIADDSNDRVIKISKDGHLILTDGRSTAEHKFTPNADGLWVLDEAGGTEIVKGGIITGGNTGGDDGGGVYIEPGGRFTMNGGSIVGCQARSQYNGAGGGVKVECKTDPYSGIISNGTFTMNGGAIIGCVACHGGGVEIAGGEGEYGTFTMNGGVIDSCVAADGRGGGVLNDGIFIMGKSGAIKNCKAFQYDQYYLGGGVSLGGDRNILNGTIISEDVVDTQHIFVNATVTIGADADIRANMYSQGHTIALADDVNSATIYGKITNDSYGGASCYADGLVAVTYRVNGTDYATQILKSGSAAIRPADPAVPAGRTFDGWYKTDGTKWDFTTALTKDIALAGWLYVPVTNETELKAALADDTVDVIRLMRNIDINTDMVVERTVVLDLNGYVLRQTADRCVSFKVEETGDLTIIDSNPTAPHKFTPNSDGLWVWDETGGTKTVHGGVITGNTAGNSGTIQIGGTVTMSAGNLVGCSTYNTRSGVAPSCGAVYVSANSKFVMNGGAIRGSFARIGDGGGVYVNGGQFTMNGGSITDCTVEYHGGGVYVNFGTFKLVDGYIRNCKANFGGGVCVRANMVSGKDGIFEMSGGVISDCTAKTKGSALIIEGNQLDDIGYAIGGTMYAGGGTVDGTAYIMKYGKITAKGGMTGVTSFKKEILTKAGSKIEYGLFYGDITGEGTVSDLIVTYMIKGVEYAKQVLPSGALATRPDAPTTMGYTFGGWNKADGTAWDYATDTVTESITLYADLTPKTYTVTFDTAGGLDIATKTMTATYGKSLANMPVPRREGYVFLGWYDAMVGGKCYGGSDGNGTDAYDKDGNITLYAQWMEAPSRMVYFNTCGGTMTGPTEVLHKTNTPIAKTDDPTKPGYTFTGWYTDSAFTQAWNFDDWVTGELRLYAGWTVNQYTITIKPENGEADTIITQDFGTAVTAPNLTKTGYTFMGWDKTFPTTMPAENVTITAQWKINQYTITFDTADGSEIASITQDYGSTITAPANPTREGYTFIGWNKEIPETMPAENITITAQWKDSEKPTGEIKINENSWKTFLNNITFGLFFKDTQTVTINAADNSGNTVKIEYLLSAKKLTETELASSAFTAYTAPFGIDPDNEYIIYVRLTDNADNLSYICSDGIVLDGTSPVIKGIENGKTYCEAQTVAIDEKYIDTVIVNETKVTLDENNSFVLSPADGEQKIIVTDKAGNTAEMTVTVNDGHTFGEWASNGDGTHTHKCTVDGCNGTETKDCSGGKATCTEKAVCEVCGKAYGKFEANNHSDLKHIDAKAATKDAEGNIEYWYCSGCNQYYSDKDGTKEIKKTDTVTAKLPQTPQTGDTSNLALWIVLLFISGGAAIGTTVISRKKTNNR